MQLPLISIVIPSFNQGAFIAETLQSVLDQHYPRVELIVIDGGSTDTTLEELRHYEKHLAYWVSEKDSGQSEAINKGLKLATGDIVTWLNSDDRYCPGTLHYVANHFLAQPDADFLHGKSRLFGEGLAARTIGPERRLPLADYLAFMRFPQPSSFFRKRVVQRIGPVNELLHYAMDFEWVVKALLTGAQPTGTGQVLSEYRLHSASKSNHELLFLREWTNVFVNVLHSVPDGRHWADELIRSGLAPPDGVVTIYPCSIAPSPTDLESAFLQHVLLHFHHLYRHFRYAECRRLAKWVSGHYPKHYVEKQYKKYLLRMTFVPKFVLRFARTHR